MVRSLLRNGERVAGQGLTVWLLWRRSTDVGWVSHVSKDSLVSMLVHSFSLLLKYQIVNSSTILTSKSHLLWLGGLLNWLMLCILCI